MCLSDSAFTARSGNRVRLHTVDLRNLVSSLRKKSLTLPFTAVLALAKGCLHMYILFLIIFLALSGSVLGRLVSCTAVS